MAYSPERKREILDDVYRLMANGYSVLSIFQNKMIDDLPIRETFNNWVFDKEEFVNYTRAREMRADFIFEEMQSIADDVDKTTVDITTVSDKGESNQTIIKDNVERSRLKIDARKFMVARMNPKVYGNKIQAEITNPALDELRRQFPDLDKGEAVISE
jgi:hypothetical protein